MSFARMMKDTITVLKSNGETVDGLKASVSGKGITLMRSDVLIESNDLIQRKMSNGGEETFKVIDPGFHEGLASIPAHYQMKVQKLGIPEAKKEIQSITYNISGANARVNNHSVDNSVNIANISPEISEQLRLLRDEIKKVILDIGEQKDSLDIVDEIEGQLQSGSAKKPVLRALVAGLPSMGSISSIGSFLLSLLEKL